jgi:hypothetical protein
MFFTSYIVCQVGGVMYGTGKHMVDLDPWNAQTALHVRLLIFYLEGLSNLRIVLVVLRALLHPRNFHAQNVCWSLPPTRRHK